MSFLKKATKHNGPYNYINYPYGSHMDNNMKGMENIIDNFLLIADKELSLVKNVCLVGMGVSGAIISTIYYQAIKKKYPNIVVNYNPVRKNGETAHSDKNVFTARGNTLYIFVDDFIEKGETINQCWNLCASVMANFKFDYIVCAYISCPIEKLELLAKNIVYRFK